MFLPIFYSFYHVCVNFCIIPNLFWMKGWDPPFPRGSLSWPLSLAQQWGQLSGGCGHSVSWCGGWLYRHDIHYVKTGAVPRYTSILGKFSFLRDAIFYKTKDWILNICIHIVYHRFYSLISCQHLLSSAVRVALYIYLLVGSREPPHPLHFWIIHKGIYLIENNVFMGGKRIMWVSSLMSIFSENVTFSSRCLFHLRTSLEQWFLTSWGFSLLQWVRLASPGISVCS